MTNEQMDKLIKEAQERVHRSTGQRSRKVKRDCLVRIESAHQALISDMLTRNKMSSARRQRRIRVDGLLQPPMFIRRSTPKIEWSA